MNVLHEKPTGFLEAPTLCHIICKNIIECKSLSGTNENGQTFISLLTKITKTNYSKYIYKQTSTNLFQMKNVRFYY